MNESFSLSRLSMVPKITLGGGIYVSAADGDYNFLYNFILPKALFEVDAASPDDGETNTSTDIELI